MRTIHFAAVSAVLMMAMAVLPISAIYGTPRSPMKLQAVNGGSKCAVCTLVVALVAQTSQLKNVTAEASMDLICGYLPSSTVQDICKLGVSLFGGDIAPLINAGETPDTVCNTIKFCSSESGQMCRLFPEKQGERSAELQARINAISVAAASKAKLFGKSDICTWLPEVCQVEDHLPAFDTDKDTFSTYESLRGTYWRGKDCDDLDASVFPGRDSNDLILDSNCNGIVGVDNDTLKTYEDEWCKGTGAMGVAALGDSATAHFRLPPDYLTASLLSNEVFAHVVRLIENEADWPMLSWSTGHLNASGFEPDVSGPTDSLYLRLRANNLCNHRDYANIGVNGAASGQLAKWASLLNRNRSNTAAPVKPMLLVMSMIGNDVCDHHHNFNSMTTPQEYRENVIAGLQEADKFLPDGSHVVLIPLVDGRILFDEMHNRIHPIGSTNKDVTYTDLYDYLNCLEISPCWGWMNSNETVRNMTWAHASALNDQLPIIANISRYEHITVHYLGNIFDEALKSYKGPRWQLIEPVDGFHPSQIANALLGEYLFNAIQSNGLVGAPNPNNAAIAAKFGDQGGY